MLQKCHEIQYIKRYPDCLHDPNCLYLSKEKRANIENERKDFTVIAEDKHKLAIIHSRQGKYIEELLKDE